MPGELFEDRTFTVEDLPEGRLAPGDYQSCTFQGLDLHGQDLGGLRFMDCAFEQCDLSLCRTEKTALREVRFTGCKLLGWRWDACAPFGLEVSFTDCLMDSGVFADVALKGTVFRTSRLHGCDLSGADLTDVVFDDCDLADAAFEGSKLHGTDFRTAVNYRLDLDTCSVKAPRFGLEGLPGLLARYDIRIG